MESTTIASIQEVPVKDVFAMFRTVFDFSGMYTWKYQWRTKSKKGQKFLVGLLMFHSCFNIALQLFIVVRLLFVISWNKLGTGTEMVKVTYCLTYLFTLGVNIVSITSARINWDLLLEKLHEAKGTVGRRLIKFYKFLLGAVLIVAVGYSAYIYTSLSRLKPGDKMDILTFCRVAPITPDMFIWNIFKLLDVLMSTFAITRMNSLLAFYFLAAYHIVREFKLLKKKVTDLEQLGHCVTFDIIKDLRLQYEHSVSLTKILDLLLTWTAFLPLAREEFPIEIEFLMGACLYITILTLAETLVNTASKGMEDALYQIGIDWSDDKTTRAIWSVLKWSKKGTLLEVLCCGWFAQAMCAVLLIDERQHTMKQYQTFLSRVSTSDVGITALGFFTISKGTVLTMVGTIVSYVIVILQFSTSSDSIQARPNATLHQ